MTDAQLTAITSLIVTFISVFGGWIVSKGFRIVGRRRNLAQDHIDLERSYDEVYGDLRDLQHRVKTADTMRREGRPGWEFALEDIANKALPANELEKQRSRREGDTAT